MFEDRDYDDEPLDIMYDYDDDLDFDTGLEYDDYDDGMDGDHDSAMRDAGWGTDEDYGYFGGEG